MTVRILPGDCRAVLRTLPERSVHMAVTSPPYWGLRDYQIEPTIWGGEANHEHEWGADRVKRETRGTAGSTLEFPNNKNVNLRFDVNQGAFCRCGAWRGVFGLEPTWQMYVEHSVEVFREVRRVLRDDGTLWLNLGDSYATGAGAVGQHPDGGAQGAAWSGRPAQGANSTAGYGRSGRRGGTSSKRAAMGKHEYLGDRIAIGPTSQPNRMPQSGLKPKDLCGIPWRVAFALQEDGWWLRQDIIWAKPNPMPESTEDRCTKAHEYLFLLSKREVYYFDAVAIAEPSTFAPGCGWDERAKGDFNGKRAGADDVEVERPFRAIRETRNKRSVWTVATQPFPEAHFATFPPALIEPCILASTSERGCCTRCAAPWRRVTAPSARYAEHLGRSHHDHADDLGMGMMQQRGENRQNSIFDAGLTGKEVETLGWRPTCSCDGVAPLAKLPPRPKDKSDAALAAWRLACRPVYEAWRAACAEASKLPVVPATVLDPFGGAGTSGLVADRRGRDAVLVELGDAYVEMARARINGDSPLFGAVAAE